MSSSSLHEKNKESFSLIVTERRSYERNEAAGDEENEIKCELFKIQSAKSSCSLEKKFLIAEQSENVCQTLSGICEEYLWAKIGRQN